MGTARDSHRDGIFKTVCGQPEHARGTLRMIFPAVLSDALDSSTRALQPGNVVDTLLNLPSAS